jgi:hypothetical protein
MIGQTVRLVSDSARSLARRMIDRAPPGSVVNIREATRTNEQNAKMHAMLSDIARAKPDGRVHTTDQWKAIFMAACGHKPSFLPALEGDDFLCTGYRSSRLTKAEMSDLIECMYEFGARKGVEWSEPKEEAA